MSSHSTSSATVDEKPSSSVSQSFYPWVRHQSWSLTVQISAAVGLLFYLAEIAYYGPYLGKNSEPIFADKTFPVIIDVLHIMVISVFIVMTIWLRDDNKRGSERIKFIYDRIFYGTPFVSGKKPDTSKKSDDDPCAEVVRTPEEEAQKEEDDRKLSTCYERLNKFKRNFLWFWVGMLSLYVVLGCSHALSMYDPPNEDDKKGDKKQVNVVVNIFDETHDLSKKSKGTEPTPLNSDQAREFKLIILPALAFFVNTVTMIPMFSCFLIMYFVSSKHKDDDPADTKGNLTVGDKKGDKHKIRIARYWFFSSKHKDDDPDDTKGNVAARNKKSDKHKIKIARYWFFGGVVVFCLVYVVLLPINRHAILMDDAALNSAVRVRAAAASEAVPNAADLKITVDKSAEEKKNTDKAAAQTSEDQAANDNKPTTGQVFHATFFALSGMLNALIFALLITRLDSKLLGLHSWLICILYSYAAIQPLFAVFEFKLDVMPQIMTAVIALAFILKIYFFLIIMYAVQTGKMLNYFYCFPALSELSKYSADLSGQIHVSALLKESFWRYKVKPAFINTGSFLFENLFPLLIGVTAVLLLAAIFMYESSVVFPYWDMLFDKDEKVRGKA